MSLTESPDYPKPTVWEGIAIAAGAVAIVGTALAGLWVKALENSFDPERAEALAKSLIAYDIPGGSRGVMGVNVGGTKTAFVTSKAIVPELQKSPEADKPTSAEVQLWVERLPVRRATDAEDAPELADESLFLLAPEQEKLEVIKNRSEQRFVCDRQVPVKIEIGQVTIGEPGIVVPAIVYKTSVTIDTLTRNQYVISLLTLGRDREAKAEQVFNSIECKL